MRQRWVSEYKLVSVFQDAKPGTEIVDRFIKALHFYFEQYLFFYVCMALIIRNVHDSVVFLTLTR